MKKELRIFFKDGLWHAELWSDFEEPFHSGKQFEDKVYGLSTENLNIEIKNKGWYELLKSNQS
ncbi:hypothetical protein [Flavobacterium phage V186]|nr:hypothetical protein [Flavobacterium phage FCOV-S1]QCW21824.1 hypothetical protein [Flavobacterium phage FCOV-S2]QCW21898.1 hypothetical protein [Flavobacterium phage V186]QNJ53898.1 hypothetical protein [Flavobacterium phage FCOV-F56]QNJ54124.1 hypothetical protein [Flavobacterium phage V186]